MTCVQRDYGVCGEDAKPDEQMLPLSCNNVSANLRTREYEKTKHCINWMYGGIDTVASRLIVGVIYSFHRQPAM